jgi:class 3 adenylate cyclase
MVWEIKDTLFDYISFKTDHIQKLLNYLFDELKAKEKHAMAENKSIDALVINYLEKEADLQTHGKTIEESAHPIVVGFIDLSDSTQIKSEISAQKWLGYIYKFIDTLTKRIDSAGGKLVKRIGDELMLTFDGVEQAETFLEEIESNTDLKRKYRYKIALDYGTAYFFRFSELMPDDPYGVVIDRCARIAKIAESGAVFCGSAYIKELVNQENYWSAGKFSLKGIGEPEEIFVRNSNRINDFGKYIALLVDTMNMPKLQRSGYRYVSRQFNHDFFAGTGTYDAHPFLLRELLNVPMLPFSLEQFIAKQKCLENKKDNNDFIGSFVEWRGYFRSYSNSSAIIYYTLGGGGGG